MRKNIKNKKTQNNKKHKITKNKTTRRNKGRKGGFWPFSSQTSLGIQGGPMLSMTKNAPICNPMTGRKEQQTYYMNGLWSTRKDLGPCSYLQ
jgi:hypothetical protein